MSPSHSSLRPRRVTSTWPGGRVVPRSRSSRARLARGRRVGFVLPGRGTEEPKKVLQNEVVQDACRKRRHGYIVTVGLAAITRAQHRPDVVGVNFGYPPHVEPLGFQYFWPYPVEAPSRRAHPEGRKAGLEGTEREHRGRQVLGVVLPGRIAALPRCNPEGSVRRFREGGLRKVEPMICHRTKDCRPRGGRRAYVIVGECDVVVAGYGRPIALEPVCQYGELQAAGRHAVIPGVLAPFAVHCTAVIDGEVEAALGGRAEPMRMLATVAGHDHDQVAHGRLACHAIPIGQPSPVLSAGQGDAIASRRAETRGGCAGSGERRRPLAGEACQHARLRLEAPAVVVVGGNRGVIGAPAFGQPG